MKTAPPPLLAVTLGDPAGTGRGDPRRLVEALKLAATLATPRS